MSDSIRESGDLFEDDLMMIESNESAKDFSKFNLHKDLGRHLVNQLSQSYI